MNETKSLTLDEAKAQIREYRKASAHAPSWARGLKSQAEAADTILAILARVEQPSENDRAVLWLMKWKGWKFLYDQIHLCWMRETMRSQWGDCNPAEEAKKLGWKP